MECYRQFGSTSISRVVPVYDTGWRVQADQEDSFTELDLGLNQLKGEIPRLSDLR